MAPQSMHPSARSPLNESPSEKEGKCQGKLPRPRIQQDPLNESPSEKEGKLGRMARCAGCLPTLNESPSEKEGK